MTEEKKIAFDEVVKHLLNQDAVLPTNLIFRLSDISSKEAVELNDIWLRINPERRLGILQDMEMITEENLIVSFDETARIGLNDPVGEVRETALRCLWESEDPAFIPILLEKLDIEENIRVSSQIIHTLGKYILLGETGQILESKFKSIMEKIETIYLSDGPAPLRQKALEALSFSSHTKLDEWVENAIDSMDENWLKSALYSIGNIGDLKWEEVVLENLDHPENIILMEAVRASGEMGCENARETLVDLLNHNEGEIRMAAVWSLSEIGGEGVSDILEALRDEIEDEDELDFLEDAIENFLFQADLKDFDMMDIFPEAPPDDSDTPSLN